MLTIEEYIAEHYASKAEFARAQGILPQQVTQWVNAGYLVTEDHLMVRPMRSLAEDETELEADVA